MLSEPEPQIQVVTYLLLAIRDGIDRYRLHPGTETPDWYDMSGRLRPGAETPWWYVSGQYNGQELELHGPIAETAQKFSGVLADLSGNNGAWSRFRQWVRRHWGGTEFGNFQFPVGHGTVRIEYKVRWSRRAVAELEIMVGAIDDTLVEAAHRDLQAFVITDDS